MGFFCFGTITTSIPSWRKLNCSLLPERILSVNLSPRDLFLTTLEGAKADRLPVWFADHYGYWDAHFRAAIGSSSLQEILSNSDAMIAQAIESARRWQLDAVTVPTHSLAASKLLAQAISYDSEGGNRLEGHLHSPQQIRSLHVRTGKDILSDETHIIEAVIDDSDQRAVVVRHMGPLTLAGHLIEGEVAWQPRLRALLYQYPTEARTLITQAAGAIVAYGRHIRQAGAQVLYIDEAWSALLGPEDQSIFVLPYLERIAKSLAPFPVIMKAPGMDTHAEHLRKAGICAWLPDMHTNAPEIRNNTMHSLALLGPFDPGRLLSPIPVIRQAVGRLVESYGERDFIVSLASSPLPHTDPRHLQAYVEAARNISIQS